MKNGEYRKICNVCGHIWCYTDEDFSKNEINKKALKTSSVATAMMALGGASTNAILAAGDLQHQSDAIVDFDKCPNCGSKDVKNYFGDDKTKNETKVPCIPTNVSLDNLDSIFKRAKLFLEDKEWQNAQAYFNAILDVDPENADAYIGLLCVKYKITTFEDAENLNSLSYLSDSNYEKAVRFADTEFKSYLEQCEKRARDNVARKKEENTDRQYQLLIKRFENVDKSNVKELNNIKFEFVKIKEYKDVKDKINSCEELISAAENQKDKERKKDRKKAIIIASIGVIVAAIIIVVCIISNQAKKYSYDMTEFLPEGISFDMTYDEIEAYENSLGHKFKKTTGNRYIFVDDNDYVQGEREENIYTFNENGELIEIDFYTHSALAYYNKFTKIRECDYTDKNHDWLHEWYGNIDGQKVEITCSTCFGSNSEETDGVYWSIVD